MDVVREVMELIQSYGKSYRQPYDGPGMRLKQRVFFSSQVLLKLILIACNPSYSRGRELEHHAWLEASPGK
jgi:hypothetical protein